MVLINIIKRYRPPYAYSSLVKLTQCQLIEAESMDDAKRLLEENGFTQLDYPNNNTYEHEKDDKLSYIATIVESYKSFSIEETEYYWEEGHAE